MRIQPITNQSVFRGKLVQLSRSELFGTGHGKSAKDLAERLDSNVAKSLNKLVEKEPFDLFVFRFKQYPQFCEMAANTSRENIIDDKYLKQIKHRVFVHSSMPESEFINAAKDAIDAFKNFQK